MRAFIVLTRLRMLDVLRSRSSASFVLLFPVILLVVVGFVFANGHPFEQRGVAVVASGGTPDGDLAAAVETLGGFEEVIVHSAPTEAEAMGKLRARMVSAVLVAPTPGGPLDLRVGPRDQLFARGLAETLGGAARPVATRTVVLEVPRFGYVHYLFPGILTFSIVLSGLFGLGYTMVLYRQNRFLKKLATTPMSKVTFVAAQIVSRGALVMAQIVLLLAVARLGFGVPIDAVSAVWILGVGVLGLLAFLGAGFALACAIRTEDLVVDIISAVNLPLVLLSEIFFSLDALPRPLAVIGGLLPSTEMVRVTRAVMLYGTTDFAVLAPGLAVLAGWAVVTLGVSLVVFRWHD